MKSIKNLFLVDDDEIFTFLTKRTIEETQLVDQIKIFSNGQDALEFLEKAAGNKELLPEVILLDINMPILDGWGFLEEFILLQPSIGKRITIYVVSTSISPFDLERAKNVSGVSDFIIKPITKTGLINILGSLSPDSDQQ
jgi:CheY-like chemotaxis protein